MSSKTGIRIILGVHTFDENAKEVDTTFPNPTSKARAILNAFKGRGYKDIDTARNYPPENHGASEALLGKLDAVTDFTVHTKILSGTSGDHQSERVAASISKSFEALKTDYVETMYLHIPDRDTPLEQPLKAMDEAQRDGKFKHFGISNYTAAEVQEILDICESKGYVKPSVYQGHYNAITRGAEAELLPILRKHNIAFWIYSPAAGGLFSGSKESSARWRKDNLVGNIYSSMYEKPAISEAVNRVFDVAAKHDISGHAAVLRWVTYHSQLDAKYGDGIIFSVSKLAQLDQTLDALEAGPLPDELADVISAVYATVKDVEPPYHQ